MQLHLDVRLPASGCESTFLLSLASKVKVLYSMDFTRRIHNRASFPLWSTPSLFLGPFLRSSPVTYWTPTSLGAHLLMSYLFASTYCLWGSQGKNTEEVFHSLLQWTSLSELSSMIRPSWVALHGLAHSFIELHKAVIHVVILVKFSGLLL